MISINIDEEVAANVLTPSFFQKSSSHKPSNSSSDDDFSVETDEWLFRSHDQRIFPCFEHMKQQPNFSKNQTTTNSQKNGRNSAFQRQESDVSNSPLTNNQAYFPSSARAVNNFSNKFCITEEGNASPTQALTTMSYKNSIKKVLLSPVNINQQKHINQGQIQVNNLGCGFRPKNGTVNSKKIESRQQQRTENNKSHIQNASQTIEIQDMSPQKGGNLLVKQKTAHILTEYQNETNDIKNNSQLQLTTRSKNENYQNYMIQLPKQCSDVSKTTSNTTQQSQAGGVKLKIDVPLFGGASNEITKTRNIYPITTRNFGNLHHSESNKQNESYKNKTAKLAMDRLYGDAKSRSQKKQKVQEDVANQRVLQEAKEAEEMFKPYLIGQKTASMSLPTSTTIHKKRSIESFVKEQKTPKKQNSKKKQESISWNQLAPINLNATADQSITQKQKKKIEPIVMVQPKKYRSPDNKKQPSLKATDDTSSAGLLQKALINASQPKQNTRLFTQIKKNLNNAQKLVIDQTLQKPIPQVSQSANQIVFDKLKKNFNRFLENKGLLGGVDNESLNFEEFKQVMNDLYFIQLEKLLPKQLQLIKDIWIQELQVSEECIDVQKSKCSNILMILAGIQNLRVSSILTKSLVDQNENQEIVDSKIQKFITFDDDKQAFFTSNTAIDQFRKKYIDLCDLQKMQKKESQVSQPFYEYKPQINPNSSKIIKQKIMSTSVQNITLPNALDMLVNPVYKSKQRIEILKLQKEEDELEGCTFSPLILGKQAATYQQEKQQNQNLGFSAILTAPKKEAEVRQITNKPPLSKKNMTQPIQEFNQNPKQSQISIKDILSPKSNKESMKPQYQLNNKSQDKTRNSQYNYKSQEKLQDHVQIVQNKQNVIKEIKTLIVDNTKKNMPIKNEEKTQKSSLEKTMGKIMVPKININGEYDKPILLEDAGFVAKPTDYEDGVLKQQPQQKSNRDKSKTKKDIAKSVKMPKAVNKTININKLSNNNQTQQQKNTNNITTNTTKDNNTNTLKPGQQKKGAKVVETAEDYFNKVIQLSKKEQIEYYTGVPYQKPELEEVKLKFENTKKIRQPPVHNKNQSETTVVDILKEFFQGSKPPAQSSPQSSNSPTRSQYNPQQTSISQLSVSQNQQVITTPQTQLNIVRVIQDRYSSNERPQILQKSQFVNKISDISIIQEQNSTVVNQADLLTTVLEMPKQEKIAVEDSLAFLKDMLNKTKKEQLAKEKAKLKIPKKELSFRKDNQQDLKGGTPKNGLGGTTRNSNTSSLFNFGDMCDAQLAPTAEDNLNATSGTILYKSRLIDGRGTKTRLTSTNPAQLLLEQIMEKRNQSEQSDGSSDCDDHGSCSFNSHDNNKIPKISIGQLMAPPKLSHTVQSSEPLILIEKPKAPKKQMLINAKIYIEGSNDFKTFVIYDNENPKVVTAQYSQDNGNINTLFKFNQLKMLNLDLSPNKAKIFQQKVDEKLKDNRNKAKYMFVSRADIGSGATSLGQLEWSLRLFDSAEEEAEWVRSVQQVELQVKYDRGILRTKRQTSPV